MKDEDKIEVKDGIVVEVSLGVGVNGCGVVVWLRYVVELGLFGGNR